MRRATRILLVGALLTVAAASLGAGAVSAQEAALEQLAGNGTADDPYVITDAAGLQAIEQDLDGHYVLGDDVDASETAEWNEQRGFDPIGSLEEPFEGTLDGDEHTVSGLTINRHEPEYVALFAALGSEARVERLALEDVHVDTFEDTRNPYGAALAGRSEGAVRQVAVTVALGSLSRQGGIVVENEGTIEESYANVDWTKGTPAGGIAATNAGTIERSYAVGQRFTCSSGAYSGPEPCDRQGTIVGVDDDGTLSGVYRHGPPDDLGELRTEGLEREAATGTDAIESMEGLDFEGTWQATATFPVLEWQYDGPELAGVGLDHQPFEVATVADLDEVRKNRSARYVLVDDVDASATAEWNDGDGFRPIGTDAAPFAGAFDGQGHVIANMTIDRREATHVGLFGVVDDGSVTDVGLVDADVTGGAAVGTLVGTNFGTLERVRADGAVAGDRIVGGLVGRHTGTLEYGYARTAVSGTERVGGLLGSSDVGEVSEVVATGSVEGDRGDTVGGLVGERFGGAVAAAYWDVETSGQNDSAGGTALTTSELTGETARSTSLTFTEPPSYDQPWVTTGGYPALAWEVDDPVGLPGSGTAMDPYRIAEVTDLDSMRTDLEAHYVLVDDVDASETSEWNGGDGFQPIGGEPDVGQFSLYQPDERFSGTLDGQGHSIDGLTIDRRDRAGVGLFGALDADAVVTDVTIERASVRGADVVGVVAGLSDGTVEDVAVDGDVRARSLAGDAGRYAGLVLGANRGSLQSVETNGTAWAGSDVGGVVGDNDGSLETVRATGAIHGDFDVGGVAGTSDGTVRNATSTAEVTNHERSGSDLGGLVGDNGGSIVDAVAYGDVDTGSDGTHVGGLVGRNSGNVSRSYARGDVTGDRAVGGLVGLPWAADDLESVYATGTVDGQSDVGGLTGGDRDGTVTGYWDVNATGQSNSSAGIGLPTDQLTGANASDHLHEFDFASAWTTTESYPELVRQTVDTGDDEDDGCVASDTVDGALVCDLNGDGNFRDVNGDGDVSNGDVVAFFGNQHAPAWDERTDLFDFDGNDDVGQSDVIALFEHLTGR